MVSSQNQDSDLLFESIFRNDPWYLTNCKSHVPSSKVHIRHSLVSGYRDTHAHHLVWQFGGAGAMGLTEQACLYRHPVAGCEQALH